MLVFCYDLETTGTNTLLNGVHQIAGKIITINPKKQIKVLKEFNFKVRPFDDIEIDPAALEICGLTEKQIKKYPDPKEVFKQLTKILDKHKLPGKKYTLMGYYNLHFDNDFFHNWWLQASGIKPGQIIHPHKFFRYFYSGSIDVSALVADKLLLERDKIPNFKLTTIAEYLGIDTYGYKVHEAYRDVEFTLEIYKALQKR